MSRRVEAVCDHTGERTFSGVDNKSCASSDHFPGRVCWNTGCKEQELPHLCGNFIVCDCTSQSENMLKLMQWPLAKLGAESLDQVNSLPKNFFCFSLWTKWQISDMKIMMIKIDGLITDRVVRYCCQI